MKYSIDYGSLNVDPRVFSLDKFIGSDAPGTLSWLTNIEANDLDIDTSPFKEASCGSMQIESSSKMKLHRDKKSKK